MITTTNGRRRTSKASSKQAQRDDQASRGGAGDGHNNGSEATVQAGGQRQGKALRSAAVSVERDPRAVPGALMNVIFYSSGIGSYAAAKRVIEQYGTENLILLFADTLIEDDDNYRFLFESAAHLYGKDLKLQNFSLPSIKEMEARKAVLNAYFAEWANLVPGLVRVCDGRSVFENWRSHGAIANDRMPFCSFDLKQTVSRFWLVKADPERGGYHEQLQRELQRKKPSCPWPLPDRDSGLTLYIGIDWSETHRLGSIEEGWFPWRVLAPMTEPPYLDKPQMLEQAIADGLKPPRLYDFDLPHANCGGGCCRKGITAWKKTREVLPEVFEVWRDEEQKMRDFLGEDRAMLKITRGGITKPLTLTELERQITKEAALPEDDWGACGCFAVDAPSSEEGAAIAQADAPKTRRRTRPNTTLAGLLEEIQELFGQYEEAEEVADQATRSAFEFALDMGNRLARAKTLTPHGRWEETRERIVSPRTGATLSSTTATLYQRMAERREELEAAGIATVRGAKQFLKTARRQGALESGNKPEEESPVLEEFRPSITPEDFQAEMSRQSVFSGCHLCRHRILTGSGDRYSCDQKEFEKSLPLKENWFHENEGCKNYSEPYAAPVAQPQSEPVEVEQSPQAPVEEAPSEELPGATMIRSAVRAWIGMQENPLLAYTEEAAIAEILAYLEATARPSVAPTYYAPKGVLKFGDRQKDGTREVFGLTLTDKQLAKLAARSKKNRSQSSREALLELIDQLPDPEEVV